MPKRQKLVGLVVVAVGALAFLGLRGSAAGKRSFGAASSNNEVAAATIRNEPRPLSDAQVARVAALKDALRDHLINLRKGTAAPEGEAAQTRPSEPHLGLGAEDLVPVPLEQRPSEADTATFDKAAAEERAHAPRPEPPDPDLLVGLLAAVEQVTENPALRSALANSYLDAIRGLDEPDAAEARQKLEAVYRPARVH